MADIERDAEHLPWGTSDEVVERIIVAADHAGTATVLVSLNRGAMPRELFMEQLQCFGTTVLPALQGHAVTTSPWGEPVAAAERCPPPRNPS